MGQIFPTATLHRDHSISYALVCEKEISHMSKINGNPDLACEKKLSQMDKTALKYMLHLHLSGKKVSIIFLSHLKIFRVFSCP